MWTSVRMQAPSGMSCTEIKLAHNDAWQQAFVIVTDQVQSRSIIGEDRDHGVRIEQQTTTHSRPPVHNRLRSPAASTANLLSELSQQTGLPGLPDTKSLGEFLSDFANSRTLCWASIEPLNRRQSSRPLQYPEAGDPREKCAGLALELAVALVTKTGTRSLTAVTVAVAQASCLDGSRQRVFHPRISK